MMAMFSGADIRGKDARSRRGKPRSNAGQAGVLTPLATEQKPFLGWVWLPGMGGHSWPVLDCLMQESHDSLDMTPQKLT